ncbi:hypothetical protein SANTM175S_00417 [Streptomyces antimycoticus]
MFKLGLGGRMGSGRQYWSFISLRDHVAALRHILDTPELTGPVNLTAPTPVTNREITAAMGRVLRRRSSRSRARAADRPGRMSGDVLGSVRAIPRRLLDSGFTFVHPHVDEAIKAALP